MPDQLSVEGHDPDVQIGDIEVDPESCMPPHYPHWNTVHRYHMRWSENGVWERVCERLREQVREREGRDAQPSAGVIDARSVRGASTVTSPTRGYDAGKVTVQVFGVGRDDRGGLSVQSVAPSASTGSH